MEAGIVVVFFNIALLFALLPFLGIYAAAIASTVSYEVTTIKLNRLLHPPAHTWQRSKRTEFIPEENETFAFRPILRTLERLQNLVDQYWSFKIS
jgi:hypothetical protein